MSVNVCIGAPVQWSPLGFIFEQPHRLDILECHQCQGIVSTKCNDSQRTYVVLICCKAMIDTRRQNNQIVFLQPNPHPLVTLAPNVEVACAISDVSDLLILVEVLVEERLDFVLVYLAHGRGTDGNFISVPVAAVFGDAIYRRDLGRMVVEHS